MKEPWVPMGWYVRPIFWVPFVYPFWAPPASLLQLVDGMIKFPLPDPHDGTRRTNKPTGKKTAWIRRFGVGGLYQKSRNKGCSAVIIACHCSSWLFESWKLEANIDFQLGKSRHIHHWFIIIWFQSSNLVQILKPSKLWIIIASHCVQDAWTKNNFPPNLVDEPVRNHSWASKKTLLLSVTVAPKTTKSTRKRSPRAKTPQVSTTQFHRMLIRDSCNGR